MRVVSSLGTLCLVAHSAHKGSRQMIGRKENFLTLGSGVAEVHGAFSEEVGQGPLVPMFIMLRLKVRLLRHCG